MLDDIATIANQYNPDLRRATVWEYNHEGKHMIPDSPFYEGIRQFTKMEMKRIGRYIKRLKIIMRLGDVIRANYRCITDLKTVPKTSCNLYVYDGQRVQKYGCCNVKKIFQVWRPHPTTGIFMEAIYWKHVLKRQHVFVDLNKLSNLIINKHDVTGKVAGRTLQIGMCLPIWNMSSLIAGCGKYMRCELTTNPNILWFEWTRRSYRHDFSDYDYN